jgi:hypothetical protein
MKNLRSVGTKGRLVDADNLRSNPGHERAWYVEMERETR